MRILFQGSTEMSERVFSKLASQIIEKVQTHAVIPIDLDSLQDEDVQKLGLNNFLFTHILPFNIHMKLGQIVDRLFKESPDNMINANMNNDLKAISWIISYGIVDDKGDPIFSEENAVLFSSKYTDLVYFLCWEVLKTNGFVKQVRQELVGNSEGTAS